MPSHQGRHEMPGWRGYLPDSIDRAARRRSRPREHPRPVPNRVVAAGALAVAALAGGVVVQTRSAGPPEALPGSTGDADAVHARSSAWAQEATPVLTALDTELRRVDDVRRRWDASPPARRVGSPPDAVVALLERRTELLRHRDALRATMTVLRSTPDAESALANAWPQLRAAQEMLRALDSGRGVLGDPVEARVLRLALEQGTATPDDGPRREDLAARGPGEVETPTVALAASVSEVAGTRGADAPSSSPAAADAADTADTADTEVEPEAVAAPAVVAAPSAAPTAEAAAPDTVDVDQTTTTPETSDQMRVDSPVAEEPNTSVAAAEADPDPTILTFDRPALDDTTADPSTDPTAEPDAEPDEGLATALAGPAEVPDAEVPDAETPDAPEEPAP
ncbi:hypothetical protein [Actinomycetospora lemnae]|uniref:DUF5667 domain-containing protein n=1 Tax=Actinomycetospora lemnae TaxID=3019891 RepID=A0ABT5T2X1_9PSEU|nr:hypothetical protein [Actinomycetospora sp. DW7H6]MDD7969349.1 hypothetical protein [Actinomycetospora sp. DW7H6]